MPPKRPAKLTLAVGVSDDKPAVETVESRAAAAAEPLIGSDKFESHGLVVDKSGTCNPETGELGRARSRCLQRPLACLFLLVWVIAHLPSLPAPDFRGSHGRGRSKDRDCEL